MDCLRKLTEAAFRAAARLAGLPPRAMQETAVNVAAMLFVTYLLLGFAGERGAKWQRKYLACLSAAVRLAWRAVLAIWRGTIGILAALLKGAKGSGHDG